MFQNVSVGMGIRLISHARANPRATSSRRTPNGPQTIWTTPRVNKPATAFKKARIGVLRRRVSTCLGDGRRVVGRADSGMSRLPQRLVTRTTAQQMKQFPKMHRRRPITTLAGAEALERRTLLADPLVSINVKQNASESDPAGAGVGQFTVRRSGGVARALDVSVRFSQAASSATQGADFEPLVRSVRIRAGRAYAHFNLKPIDDVVADPAETVVVKLHPSTAYDINPARPKVRLRIDDNETSVSIFATDANASEESPTGSGRGEFTVRRFGPADEPLVVGYYVRNTSTATRGEDFESLSGTLTIPAGEGDVSFGVTPIDDDDVEDDEALVLTLRASADYARLRHTATVTIADNDEVGSQGWWDARWDFRVPLSVSAGANERTDMPVVRAINFT